MDSVLGVAMRLTRLALVTAKLAVPETLPSAAVTVTAPLVKPTAKPWLPEALEIGAVAALDDVHVTEVVSVWVEWSENVPVAANVWVVPLAMVAALGVTPMLTSVAEVIARFASPEIDPRVAAMVAVPLAVPLANPRLEIGVPLGLDDVQVTWLVRF
jgi:hypothetical protein